MNSLIRSIKKVKIDLLYFFTIVLHLTFINTSTKSRVFIKSTFNKNKVFKSDYNEFPS